MYFDLFTSHRAHNLTNALRTYAWHRQGRIQVWLGGRMETPGARAEWGRVWGCVVPLLTG